MRIPLLSGRLLRPEDDAQAPRVVVINRAMADRYWPGISPLGARVRVTAGPDEGTWFQIVGIIDNVRHVALAREPVDEMYYAYAQAPTGAFAVVARAETDPTKAVAAMRAAVRALDPSLPIYDVRTMHDRMAASFAPTRATMVVLAVAAALAVSFAAIAIYGSVWYSVSQRTAEIGLRIALGATRLSVWIRVVGRALRLTASGAAAGLAGAFLMRPLLAGMLFRTSAGDIRAYAGGLAFVILLTIVASASPAWRAMRVDPVVALRDE
jgi:putative ABC transport system permease protein